MKLIPLRQWVCDSCGEIIQMPEDGWFEWYEDRQTGLEAGHRIVHRGISSPRRPDGTCQYDSKQLRQQNRILLDMNLQGVLGSDGLARLLSMTETRKFEDMKGFVEILRRLHIPSYEEARQYWDEAEAGGFFGGANEYWPFLQSTLLDIIDRYGAD